jgi:hypothetical protein
MPNRIIKESICTSEDIDGLTAQEEVFFYRLIVNCDDYGRFDARESILKARLFPLKQLKSNEINRNLSKLCDAGLILLYQNDGKAYIQVKSWEKHQQVRNKRSKYPSFDDLQSIAIACNQLQSNVTVIQSNPIQSESESISESNPVCGGFEEFWQVYPKKTAKAQAEKSFNKLNPDRELLDKILKAIEQQKKSKQWLKDEGQFIPMPATWLNQRRWEDVLTIEPEKPLDTFWDDRIAEGY